MSPLQASSSMPISVDTQMSHSCNWKCCFGCKCMKDLPESEKSAPVPASSTVQALSPQETPQVQSMTEELSTSMRIIHINQSYFSPPHKKDIKV